MHDWRSADLSRLDGVGGSVIPPCPHPFANVDGQERELMYGIW